MTGRDLIKWITDNHAEDMPVAVQYRDGGGNYYGGELIGVDINYNGYPCLAYCTEVQNSEVCIDYNRALKPNMIIM